MKNGFKLLFSRNCRGHHFLYNSNEFQVNLDLPISFFFWASILSFLSEDYVSLQPVDQFCGKRYLMLDRNSVISTPYPRLNCLKTGHTLHNGIQPICCITPSPPPTQLKTFQNFSKPSSCQSPQPVNQTAARESNCAVIHTIESWWAVFLYFGDSLNDFSLSSGRSTNPCFLRKRKTKNKSVFL